MRRHRQIVHKLLTLIGFRQVDIAFVGEGALAKLGVKEYGLVISDWNMQPMSGHALLLAVRADHKFKNIPFIVLTAESTLAIVTAAKEAGATNYIIKPFTGATLRAKISDALGSNAAWL